jgi:HD-GYP domain-containing protein (c-di-GMP phosphodiesterase class II)
LLDALTQRLPGAREHAEGAASWALAIAVELGLEREGCLAIRETARLHDVGKVYADAELLALPESELDAEQAARLDRHAEAGSRLAQGAGIPAEACGWLRSARERYDGAGIPDGLFGGAIPLASRIIRAACAFELELAAASKLADPEESPSGAAVMRLHSLAGTEIDRGAVEALAAVLERSDS